MGFHGDFLTNPSRNDEGERQKSPQPSVMLASCSECSQMMMKRDGKGETRLCATEKLRQDEAQAFLSLLEVCVCVERHVRDAYQLM